MRIHWRRALRRTALPLGLVGLVAWPVTVIDTWDDGVLDEEAALRPIDAYSYWRAGENIRQGASMYVPLPPPGPHLPGLEPHYVYPPLLASFFALSPLDRRASLTLHLAVCLAALGVFAWVLTRLTRAPPATGTLFALTLLWLTPGMVLVPPGNAHVIGLTLSAIALVTPVAWGAAALTTAAALKVTPAWALGVLLVRCRRDAVRGTLLALLCCVAVIITAVGPGGLVHESLTWGRDVAPTLAQGQFHHWSIFVDGVEQPFGRFTTGNISPAFLPVDLLLDMPPSGQSIPLWARAWLTIAQIGAPAAVLWLTRRRTWQEQVAWVLVVATLSAPIVRAGYLPVLLLPLALHAGRRHAPAARSEAA